MDQTAIKKAALDHAYYLMKALEEIDDGDFVDTVLAAVASDDEIMLAELMEG